MQNVPSGRIRTPSSFMYMRSCAMFGVRRGCVMWMNLELRLLRVFVAICVTVVFVGSSVKQVVLLMKCCVRMWWNLTGHILHACCALWSIGTYIQPSYFSVSCCGVIVVFCLLVVVCLVVLLKICVMLCMVCAGVCMSASAQCNSQRNACCGWWKCCWLVCGK